MDKPPDPNTSTLDTYKFHKVDIIVQQHILKSVILSTKKNCESGAKH